MAGESVIGEAGFEPAATLREAFIAHIAAALSRWSTGPATPGARECLAETARRALLLQEQSDALYHTGEHTMLVTLAGQEMMIGMATGRPVGQSDWLHFMIALVLHDVGYARGACAGDDGRLVVIDASGGRRHLAAGATDASLGPVHVVRSQVHARETLAASEIVDAERVAAAIAATQFPMAPDGLHPADGSEPDLLRAADLIGQFGDRRYLEKTPALFHELAETGQAEEFGYAAPGDLMAGFRQFYEGRVAPLIGAGAALMARTEAGRGWLERIEHNVARSALPPGAR